MQSRDLEVSESKVHEGIARMLSVGDDVTKPNGFGEYRFWIAPEGVWKLLEGATDLQSAADEAIVTVAELAPDRTQVTIRVESPPKKQFLGLVDLGNNKEEAEGRFLDRLEGIVY
jgi:hypothetical protein